MLLMRIAGSILILSFGALLAAAFVFSGTYIDGTVVDLEARNTPCQRYGPNECTRFWATVQFEDAGQIRTTRGMLNRERGLNLPTSRATHQVGDVHMVQIGETGMPTLAGSDQAIGTFIYCMIPMVVFGLLPLMVQLPRRREHPPLPGGP